MDPVQRNTEPVEILTCVQKLNICQDLNGFSTPVHWTQTALGILKVKSRIESDCTCTYFTRF
jgi:hypothetical protein